MLTGKHILLGLTGGIAVYKMVEFASRARQSGADVRVVMTREATEFVRPLLLREISGNPVAADMWADVPHWNVAHIALADWADVALVAPATANLIAKLACGIADDMLTTTLLATTAPLFVAPAMNSHMLAHPATQANLATLAARGAHLIDAESGHLACGSSGAGRLPEPSTLLATLDEFFRRGQGMAGVNVLVTAAGTQEPLDPVRYLGNRSSGKMGYAIAAEALARGATVTLVSGPSSLTPPAGLAKFVPVMTARQMRDAVLAEAAHCQLIVKAAAVADYRPKTAAAQKVKKSADSWTVELEKNPDILQELGARKLPGQVLVGFAAETQNLVDNAREKIAKKNLDYIVANDVTAPQAGFNTETNLAKLLSRDGNIEEFPLLTKRELAALILDRVWPR